MPRSFPIAYEMSVTWADWRSVVMAHSPGQAKAAYFRHVSDPWPDTKYTDIRCRRASGFGDLGERFQRTATYRGVPHWRLGDLVCAVKKYTGHLVGVTGSANFRILLDSGGEICAHVTEIENLTQQGSQRHAA